MNKKRKSELQDFTLITYTNNSTQIHQIKKAYEVKEFLANNKLEDFNKIEIKKYNFVNKELNRK